MHFKVFPLDESPGFILHRLDTQLSAGLQRTFQARGFDLTPEQWGVLSRLWEEEGLHQSLLAQRVAKDRHNMTRILNLLEKGGYIRREKDSADLRVYRIYLTPEGKDLQNRLTPVVQGFLARSFEGLLPEDLNTMRRIHEHILANLETG